MHRSTLSKKDAPKTIKESQKELHENDFIVSKTDSKGKIIYCNEIFTTMSGYKASELIGANHNLIRHPHMPQAAFKIAWENIQSKKEFFGFVKNLCADGSYYWVFAYISADLDSSGKIISYTSFRRKAPQSAIDKIWPIYEELLEAEKRDGLNSSLELLDEKLKSLSMSYDEFIINLQRELI